MKKTGISSRFLSHLWDLNSRPTHYECVALPTELKWLVLRGKNTLFFDIWQFGDIFFFQNCWPPLSDWPSIFHNKKNINVLLLTTNYFQYRNWQGGQALPHSFHLPIGRHDFGKISISNHKNRTPPKSSACSMEKQIHCIFQKIIPTDSTNMPQRTGGESPLLQSLPFYNLSFTFSSTRIISSSLNVIEAE